MEYSLFPGGKRLRPVILLATCEALGGRIEDALPFACALEMIHTYSLIHDDLPAMDDDDERRGKPSNHKVFGEATAILAGDALLNLAYETMSTFCASNTYPHFLKAMCIIAANSGFSGMVGGQALEFSLEGERATEAQIFEIYKNKTAKLFMAAFAAGAACADSPLVGELEQIGHDFGIVFQITDDILDNDSNMEIIGKEKAQLLVAKLAKSTLNSLEKYSKFLHKLTYAVIERSE